MDEDIKIIEGMIKKIRKLSANAHKKYKDIEISNYLTLKYDEIEHLLVVRSIYLHMQKKGD